jgi:hypothetical protein
MIAARFMLSPWLAPRSISTTKDTGRFYLQRKL